MDHNRKELLVARIMSGSLRWGKYLIKYPSPENYYIAQEIFFSTLEDAEGFNKEELEAYIYREGLWTKKDQDNLDELPKHIEEWKVQIFKNKFDDDKKQKIIKYLNIARDEYKKTYSKRASLEIYGNEGMALTAKNKYLLASSIYLNNKALVECEDDYWHLDEGFIEEAFGYYNSKRINESEIREIARTEPWRTTWVCSKTEGSLFGLPAIHLSDEQKSLILWSGIYDSIYQHPDKPSDKTITNDDEIDGWMICQKRGERVTDDGITNEKIKNSQQILIPAANQAVARKIDELNTDHAKKVKENFLKGLNERKTI